MKPLSPVLPHENLDESIFGAEQEEYLALPGVRFEEGTVITRWGLSWKERFLALITGNVYVWVQTHGAPLQGLIVEVKKPKIVDFKEE